MSIWFRDHFGAWRKKYAIVIGLTTLLMLMLNPIPECFDCEFSNPWGRDDYAYARNGKAFIVWLIATSFLAGFSRVRWRWAVPLTIVIADLVTQPLGGVELWSLINNEGPVLLTFGLLVGFAALGAGIVLGSIYGKLRRTHLVGR